jgi:membrane protein YdbS with pleckstrin-like domain
MRRLLSVTDVAPPVDPLQPWPLTVDWRPVSSRLIIVEQIRLAGVILVLAVAGVLLWTWLDTWPYLAGALAVVVIGAIRAVLIVRSVRSWGYAERAEDLLVKHGLMVRRLSIVPYARMQFVDVSAGPLERAFGLATVELHTAAAASDAQIPGLLGPEAARLRDRLAALGETREEGL